MEGAQLQQSTHPSYQTEVDMQDLRRYENKLIACYEAEYNLNLGEVENSDQVDYPDSSEVISPEPIPMDRAPSPNSQFDVGGPFLSAPQIVSNCFQTQVVYNPVSDGLSTTAANDCESMEFASYPYLVNGKDPVFPHPRPSVTSAPLALKVPSPQKLSLQFGLSPIYTSSVTDTFTSHHEGPQRKRNRLQAPEC